MNRNEEWNKLLDSLYECAMENCPTERETAFRKQRRAEIDKLLEYDLTNDQRRMIEDLLVEIGLDAELESRIIYQQGLRDGVWILKNLEVLA